MKKIILSILLIVPSLVWAITFCNCYSTSWTGDGWLSLNYHYATNNGSCLPTGSNTYNFGTADVYFNGEFLGYLTFSPGYGTNINDYLSCNNLL